MKWFGIFLCALVGMAIGEYSIHYWNYFNGYSTTALTGDGHKCVTIFSPAPSTACYQLKEVK